jgi:hypothetical protein
LRKNYVGDDWNKAVETKFKLPPTREEAEQWLKSFYDGDSVAIAKTLRYKRADRARELVASSALVSLDDLGVFVGEERNETSYGGVPLREQIERVLDLYYPRVTKTGIIGGASAAFVRAQGLTIDLNGKGEVTIRGKKPISISDYIIRRGKFPSR